VCPLEAALHSLGHRDGLRAFAEAAIPVQPFLRQVYVLNGYLYFDYAPAPPEEQHRTEEAINRFADRSGGVLGAWEGFALPRVQTACRLLDDADDATPVAALADAWYYAWMLTMAALRPAGMLQERLRVLCIHAFGEDGALLASELVSGSANATLAANAALWEAAQSAAAIPAVRTLLLDARAKPDLGALRTVPGSASFVAAIEGLLARYGRRAESWNLLAHTWSEDPAPLIGLLRQLLTSSAPPPAEALAAAVGRRAALSVEVEARLPATPGLRARFRDLVAEAPDFVPVKEGRAEWQLLAYGSLRGALLRRGSSLVAAGSIRDAEDVFFLLPEEIDRPAGDLAARAADRRQAWQQWAQRTPPATIGRPPQPADDAAAPPATAPEPRVIRGLAASRGLATGRARVVTSLAGADRLEPGDVLVCVMTAPPWTPLFGIAAAVVTDTGAPLSHAAIVAREYGIPCVVGARGATAAIPDGALVTVDGGAGIVRWEDATAAL
jgi:pyruvate,water dikinase